MLHDPGRERSRAVPWRTHRQSRSSGKTPERQLDPKAVHGAPIDNRNEDDFAPHTLELVAKLSRTAGDADQPLGHWMLLITGSAKVAT